MDVEEDGNVYIKQVVVTLKALNKDIDHNLKVGFNMCFFDLKVQCVF